MTNEHTIAPLVLGGSDILQRPNEHHGRLLADALLGAQQATQHPGQYPYDDQPPQTALAGPSASTAADALTCPPGFAGYLAQFIYQAAPRPVPEVAVATALAVLAGVCGKAFVTHTKSGLNLYLILVARSAIGKEAMHEGISKLICATRQTVPSVSDFFDFSDFVSGPALARTAAAKPCFLNVAGEFGHKLKAMATNTNRPDGPMPQFRRVLTNLYQKSGPQSIAGGATYSNTENNIASIEGVAYSMIGETTPSTFYEALTPGMMEDGFLSRFLVMEYEGERPDENISRLDAPDDRLLDWFKGMLVQAGQLIRERKYQVVHPDEDAAHLLDAFSKECDGEIRKAGDDESRRQMWNRAHLKALKVAGLLAVSDNHMHPVIDHMQAAWAIALIRRDIAVFTKRLQSGDIGSDDKARERKLLAVALEYLKKGAADSYKIPAAMQQQGILPRKYLQIRTTTLPAFSNHKFGSAGAIDATIRSLIDSGYFMECDKHKMIEAFGFHGKCYRVLQLN